MSEKVGCQLRKKIDTKIEKAVRQQSGALLPAILESEIQASLHVAQTDCTASLEKKMAQFIERVDSKLINALLMDLEVAIGKEMFGHVGSLASSQLPATDVLVNTVQTRVEVGPSMPHQPSPYETQPGYSLQKKLEEDFSQKSDAHPEQ